MTGITSYFSDSTYLQGVTMFQLREINHQKLQN